MGITASAKPVGKDFEVPTGTVQRAVLADIVDKGMVPNTFKRGTKQHKGQTLVRVDSLVSEPGRELHLERV
jgi:hypothetical protein